MAREVLQKHLQALKPNRSLQVLNILALLEETPGWSQHRIARAMGTYSNTVNRLMKGMVEEGLVEMRGATNRSTSYHPTVAGLTLKHELLTGYSAEIVQLYGLIKREIERSLVEQLLPLAPTRVGVFGAAETGEVVVLVLRQHDLAPVAVYDNDPHKQGRRFGGVPVRAPAAIGGDRLDALVIASFGKAEEMHREVRPLAEAGLPVVLL